MRITYVCNEYPPRPHGGIGTYYQRCARALVRTGHEVTVVGIGDETSVTDDQGVRVHSLKRYPVRPLAQFGNRKRLYDWLRRSVMRGETDVIQIPEFQGMLPYPLDGCPVVVRLHMSETIIRAHRGGRARYLFRRFEWGTLNRHRNWMACSQHVLDKTIDAFGIEPDSATVVFSPLASNGLAQPPDWLPAQYVLFAGRVSRGKGAILLAEAARTFLDVHPDLHLVYAGPVLRDDARQTDDVIREIIGPDHSERVHFTGRLPNGVILALMKRARAFVFPSALEGFGQVLSEAMSMECPPITFATPPFTEFITDGTNGILVEPGSATALAEAVDEIVRCPDKRDRMGATARTIIQTLCSEEAAISSTLEFYETVRDRHRRHTK